MKKFFKILTIILACVFGVAIIVGVAGNFYFGDLNVPDWIGKIKDGINGGKTPDDHTHEYTETVVQATCTMQGYTLHECDCGESYKTDYTEMTAHNYVCVDCGAVEIVIEVYVFKPPTGETQICPICDSLLALFPTVTKAATCTTAGSGYYPCLNCTYQKSTVISALGHSYTWKYDSSVNNDKYTCSRCGDVSETRSHVHSYKKTVVQPTCTTQGYTLYSCACGESYQDDYTEMTAHNYVDYICSICGAVDPDKPAEHTHEYTETVIQATCTTQGYTLYECDCGESYQDDYTEMIAHHYVCTECGAEKDETSGDNSVAYPLTVDYLPHKVRYDEL